MDITVRQATMHDAQKIREILAHAVNHKLLRGDVSWGFLSYEGEDIEKSIQNQTAYMALGDDVIVGTFVLVWKDEGTWGIQPPTAAYIQRLAVSSDNHRQNVGAEIIDAIANAVGRYNRTHIRLTCSSANTKLCSYYLGLGFIRADNIAKPAHLTNPTAFFERPV
jgi:ribosomal protein S18 acetylase RimI-like enzyme